MFFSGLHGPVIEKDPAIQKLRQDVANRLWDIVKEDESVASSNMSEIKFVSFEDAIKELVSNKNPL